MKKLILILPIIVVVLITTISLIFLLQKKDISNPPSALINKKIPEFSMINLANNTEVFSQNDLKNKFVLINFFASWCIPCKEEHDVLVNFGKKNNFWSGRICLFGQVLDSWTSTGQVRIRILG